MTIKSEHIFVSEILFQELQPGDIFEIREMNQPTKTFVKVGIRQDEPKPFVETEVFGKSIQTVAKNLILNIETGNLEEYKENKNQKLYRIIKGYINININ